MDLPPAPADGPTLTLFCGLPGSGKTTLARRLAADGHGLRLCTDDWQATLLIEPADHDRHERLQRLLFGHGLELLRRGVDIILEDGLWTAPERTEKFTAARACGARIHWHVFDVPLPVLRDRLRRRRETGSPADYPMTEAELTSAWALFQAPAADELAAVDRWWRHTGGLPRDAPG